MTKKTNDRKAEGYDETMALLVSKTFDVAKKNGRQPTRKNSAADNKEPVASTTNQDIKETKEDTPPLIEDTNNKIEVNQNKETVSNKEYTEIAEVKINKEDVQEDLKIPSIENTDILVKGEKIHGDEDELLSDSTKEIKPSYKLEAFFEMAEGDYFGQVFCKKTDAELLSKISKFEGVSNNIMNDNIIQAYLQFHTDYFKKMDYLDFLKLKNNFTPEILSPDNPFKRKVKSSDHNTTIRCSTDTVESIRNIRTIEGFSIYQVVACAIEWFKRAYHNSFKKKQYYRFIKEYF